MEIKKVKADGRIYDVVDIINYTPETKELYGPVAVQWKECVYPERSKGDTRPGIYTTNWGSYLVHPNENEIADYSAGNIIDFKSQNIKELIQKSNKLKDMEREILTNPDNIFEPPLLDNDEPEMRALKKAVIAKQIDIYKYSPRFGVNFQNDRRLFSNNSITLSKLKNFLDNLDLKATLTVEDKSPDVPNPMNCKIVVDLVGGETDNE